MTGMPGTRDTIYRVEKKSTEKSDPGATKIAISKRSEFLTPPEIHLRSPGSDISSIQVDELEYEAFETVNVNDEEDLSNRNDDEDLLLDELLTDDVDAYEGKSRSKRAPDHRSSGEAGKKKDRQGTSNADITSTPQVKLDHATHIIAKDKASPLMLPKTKLPEISSPCSVSAFDEFHPTAIITNANKCEATCVPQFSTTEPPVANEKRATQIILIHDLEDESVECVEDFGETQSKKIIADSVRTPSTTDSSSDAHFRQGVTIEQVSVEDEDNESFIDSEQGNDRSILSQETANLLERAHDRIEMQHLQDRIVQLEELIKVKNQEIENLSGHLRRAVATKCDLVVAHTELERHHEFNLKCKEVELEQWKKARLHLQEEQSEVEKELLNEIVKLTNEISQVKRAHQQELDDWERLHRNEMLEKEYKIAQLTEELRTSKIPERHFQTNTNAGQSSSGMKVFFRNSTK